MKKFGEISQGLESADPEANNIIIKSLTFNIFIKSLSSVGVSTGLGESLVH